MNNEIGQIAQQVFNKDSLAHVTAEEISGYLAKHPYVTAARFLLAKKEYDAYPSGVHDSIITAGLYFSNPLWFEWELRRNLDVLEEVSLTGQTQDTSKETKTLEAKDTPTPVSSGDDAIVFQSYHTIDYFASQGIRLQQAELSKDKLGQQLKSFTEWLRSMKKLPSAEGQPSAPEDTNRQQMVIQHAASSIAEKEVMTEAMAEVWLKQGNHAKAAEIYHKLSLQNPSKSSYFAAKIDQLK